MPRYRQLATAENGADGARGVGRDSLAEIERETRDDSTPSTVDDGQHGDPQSMSVLNPVRVEPTRDLNSSFAAAGKGDLTLTLSPDGSARGSPKLKTPKVPVPNSPGLWPQQSHSTSGGDAIHWTPTARLMSGGHKIGAKDCTFFTVGASPHGGRVKEKRHGGRVKEKDTATWTTLHAEIVDGPKFVITDEEQDDEDRIIDLAEAVVRMQLPPKPNKIASSQPIASSHHVCVCV